MGERDVDAQLAENTFRSDTERRMWIGRILLIVAAVGWLITMGYLADLLLSSPFDVDDWGERDWAVLIGGPLCFLPLAIAGSALLAYGKAMLRLRGHDRHMAYLSGPPEGLATITTRVSTD